LDLKVMDKYKKRKIPVGFVLSTDIFEEGTPMLIRTLEGDIEAESSSDIYLMIGILGEVYPIKAEKFKKNYAIVTGGFETDFIYSPRAKNKITGDSVEITTFTKSCVAKSDAYVYAAPAEKNTKVFTSWNTEGYMYGKPGDFVAVRDDDYNDVYIIRKDIFERTYSIWE